MVLLLYSYSISIHAGKLVKTLLTKYLMHRIVLFSVEKRLCQKHDAYIEDFFSW